MLAMNDFRWRRRPMRASWASSGVAATAVCAGVVMVASSIGCVRGQARVTSGRSPLAGWPWPFGCDQLAVTSWL